MTKLFFTYLFVFVFSTTALGLGGVGVGNARSTYWSAAAGLGITYARDLSLTVIDTKRFHISNANLISSTEPVSKISFSSSRSKINNFSDLSEYVKVSYAGRNFREISVPGANGLASEILTAHHLDAVYVLLTSNLDLLEVVVDAYDVGQGMSLISPIVHSFTYDVTSPVIDQIRVPNSTWKIGVKEKILIHATDDNSGVNSAEQMNATLKLVDKKGRNGEITFNSTGMHAEGNDWYAIEFELSRYATSGVYKFDSISIEDRAKNTVRLETPESGDYYTAHSYNMYQRSTGMRVATDIMIPEIKIFSKFRPDITAPKFKQVKTVSKASLVSAKRKIFLKLTDSQSGVDASNIFCRDIYNEETKTSVEVYCNHSKSEGHDWYSSEITLGIWAPSGTYQVRTIMAHDKAGNFSYLEESSTRDGFYHYSSVPASTDTERDVKTNIPLAKFKAFNPGISDVEGPQILDVIVENPIWKVGSTARLRFKARDRVSGVKVGNYSDTGNLDGYLGLGDLAPTSNGGQIVLLSSLGIVSDGGDWFHTDISINQYSIPGEYAITIFFIRDNANNTSQLKCDASKSGTCHNSNGPAISPIIVNLIR